MENARGLKGNDLVLRERVTRRPDFVGLGLGLPIGGSITTNFVSPLSIAKGQRNRAGRNTSLLTFGHL